MLDTLDAQGVADIEGNGGFDSIYATRVADHIESGIDNVAVVALATLQQIAHAVGCAAIEDVISRASGERVRTAAAVELVVTGIACNEVCNGVSRAIDVGISHSQRSVEREIFDIRPQS